eukprot:Awhi_evm1s817
MGSCCNVFTIILFAVVVAYATVISFFGLFSLDWFVGDNGNIKLGIPSSCEIINTTSTTATYCTWDWDDLEGSKEK